MKIYGYAASGFAGQLVAVEVDIRRGIPGLDIVGLPDGAVRESRERVRIAMRRSGFDFPRDRILINLSPADLKKEGASYDLPIALGILAASGQVEIRDDEPVLCVGELLLDGAVRAVNGVLPAVAAALAAGIERFIVPRENVREAATLAATGTSGIDNLRRLPSVVSGRGEGASADGQPPGRKANPGGGTWQDLSELRGQPIYRRVLEIAAAGGHHLLVFGPPGSGKTMGIRSLAGLLPDLSPTRSVEVTRIWSQAGRLGTDSGLILRPPFRQPHHSATAEGLIGGSGGRPGEVSMAHGGVLFLDEAPEFGSKVLQSLREPLENRRVDLVRSGRQWWYPANFQLVMAMNPCACGNLGREEAACLCTPPELNRHWRRLGGALLDRVDIRIPISPVAPETLLEAPGEGSDAVRRRVVSARGCQELRYADRPWSCNADIPPGELSRYAALDDASSVYFSKSVTKLGLSSRAAHGVLKVARTLADMAGASRISADHLLEAVLHRRFGDRDLFWANL